MKAAVSHRVPLVVTMAALAAVAGDLFGVLLGSIVVMSLGAIAVGAPRARGWGVAVIAAVAAAGIATLRFRGMDTTHWLLAVVAVVGAIAHTMVTRGVVAEVPPRARLAAALVLAVAGVLGATAAAAVKPSLRPFASDDEIVRYHASPMDGQPPAACVLAGLLIGVAALAAADPRSRWYAAALVIGASLAGVAAAVRATEVPDLALASIAVGVLAHLRGLRRAPIPPARARTRQ